LLTRKLRKATPLKGVETDASATQASKSNFGLVWPRPLTSWPPR